MPESFIGDFYRFAEMGGCDRFNSESRPELYFNQSGIYLQEKRLHIISSYILSQVTKLQREVRDLFHTSLQSVILGIACY